MKEGETKKGKYERRNQLCTRNVECIHEQNYELIRAKEVNA
jgi:hypothetical protein